MKFPTALVGFDTLQMSAVVVIFSKPDCPHCVAAKTLLAQKGVAYETVNMTDWSRAVLAQYTSAKTVPQIFINDQLVEGGNAGLQELERAGKLDEMLKGDPSYAVLRHATFGDDDF